MATYSAPIAQASFQDHVFSYQKVDGLEKIYVNLGSVPAASLVFKTAEKAQECAKAVIDETILVQTMGYGQQRPDMSITDKLEVLKHINMSGEKENLVISYSAKTMGTLGRPIQTTHELLDRLGKVLSCRCPAKEIRAIPIFGVDYPFYM